MHRKLSVLCFLLLLCLLPPGQGRSETVAEQKPNILIVHFSRTGNTRALAEHIQARTGGTLFALDPATPYPASYQRTVERARRELAEDARPALKALPAPETVRRCNILFVGSPNWGGSLAPPLKTFLAAQDLSGKTIAPFMTHGGGGMGRMIRDIRKLAPGARVVDGLAVRGSAAAHAEEQVQRWLAGLGIPGR